MTHLMLGAGLALEDDRSDEARIAAYGATVLVAVASCPAFSRAEELLRLAKKVGSVYISSNTPEVALRDLVERRGWLPLVDAVYGYPRRKGDTVRQIVSDCGGRGDDVLVVGDGVSDEAAARDNGCVFVAVNVQFGTSARLCCIGDERCSWISACWPWCRHAGVARVSSSRTCVPSVACRWWRASGHVVAKCNFIDRAVVSTDNAEIARVAVEAGLAAPFLRPDSLSGDRIGDWDVLVHALNSMEALDGTRYDIVVMLQPTSPSRTPQHVRNTVTRLVDGRL